MNEQFSVRGGILSMVKSSTILRNQRFLYLHHGVTWRTWRFVYPCPLLMHEYIHLSLRGIGAPVGAPVFAGTLPCKSLPRKKSVVRSRQKVEIFSLTMFVKSKSRRTDFAECKETKNSFFLRKLRGQSHFSLICSILF